MQLSQGSTDGNLYKRQIRTKLNLQRGIANEQLTKGGHVS